MNETITPPPGAVFARNKPGCMMLCSRCQTWHLAASHKVLPSGARSATCGFCSGVFERRAEESGVLEGGDYDSFWEARQRNAAENFEITGNHYWRTYYPR